MKYFVIIDGEQKGPFNLEELPDVGVRPSTYVWCKGMADWEKAEDVADICRLYRNRIHDLMHPAINLSKQENSVPERGIGEQSDSEKKGISRFDHLLKDSPSGGLPTVDEINSRENIDTPPQSVAVYAWLVTFLCCPPTGIAAIIYANKSKNAWKQGNKQLAHDYCRLAKLLTGVSFFLGLIVYAFIIRWA